MSTWKIFLRSKLGGKDYANLGGDNNSSLKWMFTNNNFGEIIRRGNSCMLGDSKNTFYLSVDKNEIIFGVHGAANQILGESHPQAWDRAKEKTIGGRIKPIFIGYTTPKNSKNIPLLSDLNKMDNIIITDLERIFEEAEKNHPFYDKSRTFSREIPCSKRYGNNVWDKAVQKIQKGEPLNGVIKFTNESVKPEFISFSSPKEKIKGINKAEKIEDLSKKKTWKILEETPKNSAIKWGMALTGMGMISHVVLSVISVTNSSGKSLINNKEKNEKETNWTKIISHSGEAAVGAALVGLSLKK